MCMAQTIALYCLNMHYERSRRKKCLNPSRPLSLFPSTATTIKKDEQQSSLIGISGYFEAPLDAVGFSVAIRPGPG